MILNDGTTWEASDEDIIQWEKTYPAIDVFLELGKMESWLDANPKKRKTKTGVKRFVNSWLSRAQDKGGSPASLPSKFHVKGCTGMNNMTDISWVHPEHRESAKSFMLTKYGRYWDGEEHAR